MLHFYNNTNRCEFAVKRTNMIMLLVQQDKYLMKKRFTISNKYGTVFQPTILIKNFFQSTLYVIRSAKHNFYLYLDLYNV